MVDRSNSAIWRLLVLVRVAHVVTQRLSLEHQLPRLTEALDAERATLFLQDPDSSELVSRAARGEDVAEIRLPQTVGIAGSVFSSGSTEIGVVITA
jgi:adenylate cyclase